MTKLKKTQVFIREMIKAEIAYSKKDTFGKYLWCMATRWEAQKRLAHYKYIAYKLRGPK